MPRYVIICVGCLCCQTPSHVVAAASDLAAANKLLDELCCADYYPTHECQLFEVPEADGISCDLTKLDSAFVVSKLPDHILAAGQQTQGNL